MPSLLPHDLCHGQSSSRWLPAVIEFQLSYSRSWKMMLWKVLHSICNMHSICTMPAPGKPWHTPLPILNQSVVPCPVLTCFLICIQVSQKAGKVVWYSISLRIFHSLWIHRVKGFSIVDEAEVDVFLEFPCFLHDPTDVSNLISGSSASSKWSLYIWNFTVNILQKPSLKDFEHNLVSMWNEHNCSIVWTFFGILLLNWHPPVLGHC